MSRGEAIPTQRDPMLSAKSAAAEFDIGLSTFWKRVKEGKFPAPYYLNTHQPRWRLSELNAAVYATRAVAA